MKRLVSFLLVVVLVLSLGLYAYAANVNTGFSDVANDAWYAEAVAWCKENGVMNGTGATAFDPEGTLTRAMLATSLYRAAEEPAVNGAPSFTDTQPGMWYSNAVVWANANALIQGYGNGMFGTNDPVTREQLATILWRYAEEPTAGTTQIADRNAVSNFAGTAVDWVVDTGIMLTQNDSSFAPKATAARAEVAFALYTALANQDSESDNESGQSQQKSLVAYFAYSENIGDTSNMTVDAVTSASLNASTNNTDGNLQVMAQEIAAETGADVFHIIVTDPYNNNYSTMVERAKRELDDEQWPALQSKVENLDDYDVIYLGTPIWYASLPPALHTFLAENDLSGKKIILFGIHLGSGLGGMENELRQLAPEAELMDSFTVSASTSNTSVREQFSQWLSDLNISG